MSLQTHHLSKIYHYQDEHLILFEDLNIRFPEYGVVSIIGESGCGKTTLLHILAGLEKDYQGHVYLQGQNIDKIKDYQKYIISFIYQNDCLFEFLSVYDNCILFNKIKNISYQKEEVDDLLKLFHLEKEKDKKGKDLSGGQKQRVAIIRSLLTKCPIIFCDEPTAALNKEQKLLIYQYLRTYSQKHLIIIVSHDQMIKDYSDHVIDFHHLQHHYDFSHSNYPRYSLYHQKQRYALFKESLSMLYQQKLKILMIFLSQISIVLAMTILITGLYGFKCYYDDMKENTINHDLVYIQKINHQPFDQKEINKLRGQYQYLLDIGKIDNVDFFQTAPLKQHLAQDEIIVNKSFYKIIKTKQLKYRLNQMTFHFKIKSIIDDHYQEPILYYTPSSLNEKIKLLTIDLSTCLVYIDDYQQVNHYISQLSFPYEGYSSIQEQFDAYDHLYSLFQNSGIVFIIVSLFISIILMFFILLSISFDLQKYDVIFLCNGMSRQRYHILLFQRIMIICVVVSLMVCLTCFSTMVVIDMFDISNRLFQITHLFQYPILFENKFDIYIIYMVNYLVIGTILFFIMVYRMRHLYMIDKLREE